MGPEEARFGAIPMKIRVLLTGLAICVGVWIVVGGVQRYFGGMKPSAEKFGALVGEAGFADWSGMDESPDAAEGARRVEKLREVAALVNQLDFREREKIRERGADRNFFRSLSKPEQVIFFDLTYAESINRMMEALDGLPPEERRKFVERGLAELESGVAQEDMERMQELGDDLLAKAAEEGFKAYVDKASAQTKMDLAPLMEAMNETMQGLRGQHWEN